LKEAGRVLVIVAQVLLAFAAAASASPPPISNLDFEQGPVGQVPIGWQATGALRRGFLVRVTEQRAHGGRACLEIRRDTLTTASAGNGSLIRAIDAAPYRGRRLRFSGWLRFEPSAAAARIGSARLWVRVDRPNGGSGFFDRMDAHPLRASDWTHAHIDCEVASDADSISFGVQLETLGSMWADDLALEALGPIGEGDEPPGSLSERGLENVVAFARLLGYVEYFHPSDEAVATDWDSVCVAGVDRVEGARTATDLQARLAAAFGSLAPTLRLSTRRIAPLAPASLAEPGAHATRVVGWWHHGWSTSSPGGIYFSDRISKPIGAPPDSILPIGSEVNVDLGGGVWCSLPMTLYGDAEGTLPHARIGARAARPPSTRPEGWSPSANDRATRLADVILLWNTEQHFYPYFDVVATDWSAELPAALRRAATDSDGASFQTTLEREVAALHDGHGSVSSRYGDPRAMPLAWEFAEGQLVVSRADSTLADRIHPGDVVTAIEGRPIATCVRDAEAVTSAATPQWQRVRVAEELQRPRGVDTVAVDFRSPAGVTTRVRVPRRWGAFLKPPRPDSVTEIRPGVMYVDLDRVTDADFARSLPRLVDAKGVIFDLRGYPWRVSTVVLTHLVDSTITCARWNIPLVTRPDHEGMAFEFSNWTVPPVAPRIHGPIAFLIDGRAISYAETYLGMVEHYHLAALVGEPTAGTNGNVATEHLPGGFDVTFTGMKVLKHDGTRHHGVGILPTVTVSRTVAGIAAGRDEQLERAIDVVLR